MRKIAKQFENMDSTHINIPKDMVNNLAKGASAAQMTNMIGQLFPFTFSSHQGKASIQSIYVLMTLDSPLAAGSIS